MSPLILSVSQAYGGTRHEFSATGLTIVAADKGAIEEFAALPQTLI
jgi:hypothetical protein